MEDNPSTEIPAHLARHPAILEVEEARAFIAVAMDLDAAFETFPAKHVVIAYYMVCNRVLHTAQDTGYAESTVRDYLNQSPFKEYLELKGFSRKRGRPQSDTCHVGHDQKIYRKTTVSGHDYCGECKRKTNRDYYHRHKGDHSA